MQCKECKVEFSPVNSMQLYCCAACRVTANNKRKCATVRKQQVLYDRECAICATPFSTYRKQKVCCSRNCSEQFHRQQTLQNYYKRKEEMKKPSDLVRISLLAREAGISYGQYVQKECWK